MADLDQSGFARWTVPMGFGPSVGATTMLARGTLVITAAGTYNLDISITRVEVNVAAAVTINLPSGVAPTAPAITIPKPYFKNRITILDTGGNANSFPITINPAAGQNISGQGSVSLGVRWGSINLDPNPLGVGYMQV